MLAAVLFLVFLASVEAQKDLGCWVDQDNNWAKSAEYTMVEIFMTPVRMTHEKCAEYCSQWQYFALAFGFGCYCSNENLATQKAEEDEVANVCDAVCGGDEKQNCGGHTVGVRVFDGGEKPPRPAPPVLAHKEIGCFNDIHNDWWKTGLYTSRATLHFRNKDATSALCSELCKNNEYFALHVGFICICSDENLTSQYEPQKPNDQYAYCYMPCSGNRYELCGGRRGGVRVYGKQVPTPAPTPAPTTTVKCPKERETFEQNKLPVEPVFEEGSCRFLPKQCNAEKCFCVSPKTGKRKQGKLEVPLGHEYDCSKRARKCHQKLFATAIKQGESASNLPQCTARGQYALKQCNDSGECWCAKKITGKEVKNTRNANGNEVKCNA